MKEKLEHTVEEQHSAMETIAGFVYQFYYFLYKILTAEKGDTISFELYDDVASESQQGLVYYQLKHTVQQTSSIAEKSEVKLTDRAADLWKAISVWMKLITGDEKDGNKRTDEEQKKYISERKFSFVTNKIYNENKLVILCSKLAIEDISDAGIDNVLDEITMLQRPNKKSEDNVSKGGKHRRETVQNVIDALKVFPHKKQFLSKIRFESLGMDDIEAKCHEYINDTIRIPKDKVKDVFSDFVEEAVKDFTKCVNKRRPVIYTYEGQKKRFERVFTFHRDTSFEFKYKLQAYKEEFLDLVCIKQLQKVRDIKPSDMDKIAKCASQFFAFKNQFEYLKDESKILEKEEQDFINDAINFWENEFDHIYDDTDNYTEEQILKKARDLLYKIRQHRVTLQKELMLTISNGAYYYLSDECLIGWHKEWKKFFIKEK